MKEPMLDVTRSIRAFFADWRVPRRAFLGKAGAVSLGTALAALGAPRAAGAFPSVPPPTGYSTLLGVCTPGIATVSYTPGITNTLQLIHLDGIVTFSPACPVAQHKAVTAFTYSYDVITSCSGTTDVSGTGEIHYTAGQTSDYTLDSWTATRLLGQGVAVFSGLITHGPFNGARVWQFVIRAVNDPSLCASANGVTHATGTDTLILAD
jgi:hypothetical protein